MTGQAEPLPRCAAGLRMGRSGALLVLLLVAGLAAPAAAAVREFSVVCSIPPAGCCRPTSRVIAVCASHFAARPNARS